MNKSIVEQCKNVWFVSSGLQNKERESKRVAAAVQWQSVQRREGEAEDDHAAGEEERWRDGGSGNSDGNPEERGGREGGQLGEKWGKKGGINRESPRDQLG